MGRHREALVHYSRARSLLERDEPLRREDLATIDHNLGGVHHAMGEYAEGEVLARRGLAIRLGGPRPDTELVGRDLVALAALVLGQGRWSEAKALYLEGIALLACHPGDQRLELAVAFNGLGVLHGELEDYLEAAKWLERSATWKRRILGPGHPDLAITLRNLAVVRDRQRRTASTVPTPEAPMPEPSTPGSVRITLTPSQRAQVRRILDRDAEEIDLRIEELEERIAPRLATNHNEPMLEGNT
jgi:tetratricopeptide (TPR) repeat protein